MTGFRPGSKAFSRSGTSSRAATSPACDGATTAWRPPWVPPPDVMQILNDAINQILQKPELAAKAEALAVFGVAVRRLR